MNKSSNKVRVAITQDTRMIRCRLLIKLIYLCGASPVLIPFMLKHSTVYSYQNQGKTLSEAMDQALQQHLAQVKDTLSTCDALLLPGNRYDIPPRAYGQLSIHRETLKRLPCNPLYARFPTEAEMAKYALKKKWPILAVCGGMQVMNVVLGGSLIQHIPDQECFGLDRVNHVDKTLKFISRTKQLEWEKLYEEHIKTGVPKNIYPAGHSIKVKPCSMLASLYRKAHPGINIDNIGEISIHHQGCFEENLAEGLQAVAWAPDGIVEAAELTTYDNMCLLTQFHLECNVSGIAKKAVQQLINSTKI